MGFFGGSTASLPAPDAKPLGLDESRLATNEQARPLPQLNGKRRLAVTWIADAWNQENLPVTAQTGKDETGVVGYIYWATVAAAICGGPVDGLHQIWFDDQLLWEGTMTRGIATPDSVEVTVPDRGTLTLYWGTETQEQDVTLAEQNADHPPYRGVCYFVGHIQFGRDRTNAPNIEFVLSKYPAPTWMTAAASIGADANPVAVLADWLQNQRFGLGLPDTRLDTALLDSIALLLVTEQLGISPLITDTQSARQTIIQLCEYIDGYLDPQSDGKFALGLVRPENTDDAVIINESCLLDDPEISPGSWGDTSNEVSLRWTNPDRGYREDAAKYQDQGSLRLTGEPKPLDVQRPWVTHSYVAQRLAQATGRAAALPEISGRMKITSAAARDLAPGQLFKLQYAKLNLSAEAWRVIDMSWPSIDKPECDVSFKRDNGYLNEDFVTSEDTVPVSATITPEPFAAEDVLLLEQTLKQAHAYSWRLNVIASRPAKTTRAANLYQVTAAGPNQSGVFKPITFNQVGTLKHFAMRGVLLADYPADTFPIDQSGALQIEFSPTAIDKTLPQPTLDGALEGEWLLLTSNAEVDAWVPLGSASQNGYYVGFAAAYAGLLPGTRILWGTGQSATLRSPYYGNIWLALESQTVTPLAAVEKFVGAPGTPYEVMSVFKDPLNFQIAPNQYKLGAIRGWWDTTRGSHIIGQPFWLIKGSHLFGQLVDSAPPRSGWKLQPVAGMQLMDMDDCDTYDYSSESLAWRAQLVDNVRAQNATPHLAINAVWDGVSDVTVTWSYRHGLRNAFWSLWGAPFAGDQAPLVDVQLCRSDDVAGFTRQPAAWVTTAVFTAAEIAAAFAVSDPLHIRICRRGTLIGITLVLHQ